MDFVAHWKNWIRPLALMIYFILMMIAIPLCVVEVSNKTQKKHIKAWFTGGVFVLMTVPISVYEIILHVINYTQPNLQKYIIRILWMVPIYALNAWFGLRFSVAAIYLDTIRECYEAYVIYNFMAYLLSFLWTVHPQLEIALSKTKQQKHIFPFCCLPVWPMGSKMLQNAKHGVLQYTVVRPITTFIALICEISGVYHEGEFSPKSGWLYVTILNNVSQIWAMYCLVLFYKATKEMLAPIKPIPKFLCVKFVVFFSFWQSVVIAAFGKFGLIQESQFYDYDVNQLAAAMQDFCICIEMFIAAIMHYFAFSHEPFVNTEAPQGNCCQSFASMWDVGDVKDDVLEHVKVVTTTMKKTVSAPFLRRKNEPGNEKNAFAPVTSKSE
ncbi:transmembrane protein 184C-like [Dreissena polymorpha]|uniref:transmembrane protein 184C-like n=1 Tax=Dreissena polymorpha TaxID=45954 RepID=UPI002263D3C6|nr:transmembrane protein 184C-like [Dreissena polymorpha]